MVFPSLPIYLDPPNWSQQQPNQQETINIQNPQIPISLQPPPPTITGVVGGGDYQGSIRPGSMADRARLAKIHQPDVSLKCPRCESTNTKFCYYNNYSLSQPRHFCKTCRRYWTRGGALRNVPVGGGCRRNKRSKGTTSSARSKSPMKHDHHHHRHGSSSASANSCSSGCTNNNDLMGHLQTPPPQTQLAFLPNLHHYSNNDASPLLSGGSSLHFGATPSSLLVRNGNNTSGVGSDHAHEIQIGTNNGGSILSTQWRLPNLQQVHHHPHQSQQFPNFLTNLEPQVGVFQLDHGGENHGGRFVRSNSNKGTLVDNSSVGGIILPHQANMVKMEENNNNNNNQGLSLSKNNVVLGNSGNNDIFWSSGSGNAWSEVPSFNSSSTSHLL